MISFKRPWTCACVVALLLGMNQLQMVSADLAPSSVALSPADGEEWLLQYVATASDFQAAVQDGIRHIILKNHIDLRELAQDGNFSDSKATLSITLSTHSIRVCITSGCTPSLPDAHCTNAAVISM